MRHRMTFAALGLAGLGLLAACGGSPGTTITASAPEAAPAAAPVVAAAAPAPAAAVPAPAQAATGNIVQVAQAAGQFTTLVTALQAAGLVSTLEGPGPFTVFAPTDAAFAKVPKATLDALLADPAALANVLTYHVVPGRVTSDQLSNGQRVTTVQGQPVTITISGGTVKVNDATVVQADVAATNGVIHAIDAVLLPPTVPATR